MSAPFRVLAVISIVLASLSMTHGGSEVYQMQLQSSALGRGMPLSVVRPAAVEMRAHGFPVLYLLHGRGRHHATLLELPEARQALLNAPFITVLPQGEDGWYINSPVAPADRYESYLEEVIAWAEIHLSVRRDAAGRGLAGWSMGGYGAIRFAQRHAGEFGFVASIIGLLDFPRKETLPEGRNYAVPEARFGGDRSVWRRMNPLYSVEALDQSRVTLVLSREGFERTMNERFIAAAERSGLSLRVHWLEGGHHISVVERALPLVIADAAELFGGSEDEADP